MFASKVQLPLRRLFFALFLALPLCLDAQEKSDALRASNFGAGDQTMALGFGLGIRYGYPANSSIAPAVAFIYDVGVAEGVGPGTIGIGGIVGFKTASYAQRNLFTGEEFSARWNNFLIGARGSYHFALGEGFENLDLYGGIMAGLRFQRFRNRTVSGGNLATILTEYSRRETRSIVGFFGGGRYDFTPEVGAWLEIGYDVSLIKAGIHVNL